MFTDIGETVLTHRSATTSKQSTIWWKKIGDQSNASHTRKQDLTLDQEQDQNTTNTKMR